MTCKIDHTDPESLPQFLCRGCHPELIKSRDDLATLEAADRERTRAESALLAKRRDLDRATRKLQGLTRKGEPDEGSVNGKIAKSLRAKCLRLEAELKAVDSS